MNNTLDEFKAKVDLIQHVYADWFANHPSPIEDQKHSIHLHYYIFAAADGKHLRFQSNSELPQKIQSEISLLFNLLTQDRKTSKRELSTEE
jgi:hypothetical protein